MSRILLATGLCILLVLPGCTPKLPPTVSAEQAVRADGETPTLERRTHLESLGAVGWHAQGRRGKGIKIAILDSGFRDYRQFLGKGLPACLKTRSFRKDQNLEARDSQHGILCAEVLHAVAPEAELMFVNWEPDTPSAFLDAVRWAKSEGAKILSCSLIMPSWSDGEGGGEVHQELKRIIGDTMLFFASAGNTAQRHWCGTFSPDSRGTHLWDQDVTQNTLTPWSSERVAVELYGPTRSAFELAIHQSNSGSLLGRALLRVDATKACGRAVVRFEPEQGMRYQVKVRCLDELTSPRSEAFHLVALGASLEYATSKGSIPFPGDGAAVLAVGAVDGQGRRVLYSCCGPNSREPKPDFAATVPFPSLCRKQPFTGTSAAAPQAAGLAALLWSSQPGAGAREITQWMRASAVDLGPPGHDFETGHGLIRLPRPRESDE